MATSPMNPEPPATSSSKTAENVPNTTLGRLYQEHITLVMNKDIESILNQYTEDAILISSIQRVPRIYRGREGLRQHFQDILAIENMRVSVGFWGEVDDTMLMITEGIQMTVEGQTSFMRFADNWVLRNGKIAMHFAGMVQYQDGSLA